MSETYTLKICGLERHLPIMPITPQLSIASFVVLGDTELVCQVAPELIKKLPPIDAIITAEAKGIPVAFEVSRLLNMNYIIARKSVKPYMQKPLVVSVNSITTQKEQILCLDDKDVLAIKGKRVAIIDDVISTGESINAVEKLVNEAGGTVAARVAILAEGEAAERNDIIFLEKLPLFFNK